MFIFVSRDFAGESHWLLCLLSQQMSNLSDFAKQTATVWIPQTEMSNRMTAHFTGIAIIQSIQGLCSGQKRTLTPSDF